MSEKKKHHSPKCEYQKPSFETTTRGDFSSVFSAFRFIHLTSFAKHQVKWARYVKSSVNIKELRTKGISFPKVIVPLKHQICKLDVLRDKYYMIMDQPKHQTIHINL